MAAPALQVHALSKQYTVGGVAAPSTLYETLSTLLRPGARSRASRETFWALRGVDFEVAAGEVVGVIGRNGAGKSTLLKILSRITSPTEGRVTVRGRMASLLEVGTGFHPELTGRENIYLNGAILGMRRGEIARQFDAIVAFAEIGRFVDTPVKRYSSGMYVRLAFSVAAHLDPDILLIDEVLAVGDASFQKRCLGKMHDVASAGRTVIFVSHNMGAVSQLCSRAIVLERGTCTFTGRPADAISRYLGSLEGSNGQARFERDASKPAQIVSMEVVGREGEPVTSVPHEAQVALRLRYDVGEWPAGSYVCVDVTNEHDMRVVWSCDVDSLDRLATVRASGMHEAVASVPAGVLKPGRYFFSAAIYSPSSSSVHDVQERAVCVDVVDSGSFLASIGVESPAFTGIPMHWQEVR